MNLTNRIIDLIETNRISSTEVADALGKKGVVGGLMPVNPGGYFVGKIHYIYAFDESNWPVHEQIIDLPDECALYVDTFNCKDKAIFGDLVSKYLILYKKVKGIAVLGNMRDIPDLKKYKFPIWCKGFSPLGCYNLKVEESDELKKSVESKRAELNGGIMVCDDSGCTVISNDLVNDDTYNKLELIELQEDIWGFCINTLKWSTYDTICMKKYLTNPDVLPIQLREKVSKIPFKK
mgnify:CR=1 FL=1